MFFTLSTEEFLKSIYELDTKPESVVIPITEFLSNEIPPVPQLALVSYLATQHIAAVKGFYLAIYLLTKQMAKNQADGTQAELEELRKMFGGESGDA